MSESDEPSGEVEVVATFSGYEVGIDGDHVYCRTLTELGPSSWVHFESGDPDQFGNAVCYIAHLARRLSTVEGERDGWKEEARTYCKNASHWCNRLREIERAALALCKALRAYDYYDSRGVTRCCPAEQAALEALL